MCIEILKIIVVIGGVLVELVVFVIVIDFSNVNVFVLMDIDFEERFSIVVDYLFRVLLF